MKRREFVALLGGAAVAWPFVARGQQRTRRIGVLAGGEDASAQARLDEFQQSLQQLGWIHGRNVQIDVRRTSGDAELSRKYAAELVALDPDVIFAAGGSQMGPLHQMTNTVPIVFAIVPDPVGSGFVKSLAKPGGNATGFIQFEYSLAGKWLELLKEIAPGVTRAAVVWDPTIATAIGSSPLSSCGSVTWSGIEFSQRAQHARDGSKRLGFRGFRQWGSDRDGECIDNASSGKDHRTGRTEQTARRLQ